MTYAIFKAAGFQYRAELGDLLRLPSMDAESGSTVTFDEVLMGATDDEVIIGRPLLDGAAVRAKVVNHGRADKVIVFKFKRRKNYRRKAGHRQDFTEVRVSEIDLGDHGVVRLEPETSKKKAAKKEPAEAKAAEAPAKKKPAARKKTPAAEAESKAKAEGKTAPKSEARTRKKPTAKKPTAKKSTARKSSAKKSTAKKSTTKKSTGKKKKSE